MTRDACSPLGPLHGIPILVKDQVDAAGMPTALGSVVFKDYRPPLDSFVVAKLRRAGAIILGKTTLGEFGGDLTDRCSVSREIRMISSAPREAHPAVRERA